MSDKIFEVMKVFDSQEFPEDLQEIIFNRGEYPLRNFRGVQNGDSARYIVGHTDVWSDSFVNNKLSDFLIQNGAEEQEEILIKIWW
jgi:hypothetical protein